MYLGLRFKVQDLHNWHYQSWHFFRKSRRLRRWRVFGRLRGCAWCHWGKTKSGNVWSWIGKGGRNDDDDDDDGAWCLSLCLFCWGCQWSLDWSFPEKGQKLWVGSGGAHFPSWGGLGCRGFLIRILLKWHCHLPLRMVFLEDEFVFAFRHVRAMLVERSLDHDLPLKTNTFLVNWCLENGMPFHMWIFGRACSCAVSEWQWSLSDWSHGVFFAELLPTCPIVAIGGSKASCLHSKKHVKQKSSNHVSLWSRLSGSLTVKSGQRLIYRYIDTDN